MQKPLTETLKKFAKTSHGRTIESSKTLNFYRFYVKILQYAYKIPIISSFNGQLSFDNREAITICLLQHFEADFLWKVPLP